MSILVTGGAGYIGSHTVLELLNAGYDAVVIDNLCNSKTESLKRVEEITGKSVKFIKADIRDRAALDDVFANNKIDAVIHFAGLKSVPESAEKPLEYYENNIGGTVNLCLAMGDAGCKKIVFSSSATVYGGDNVSPLREDMPTGKTTNPYGTTKLYIEKILQDTAAADKDWSVCLLRYFNPIGAHESGRIGEDPRGIPNNLMPYIMRVVVGKLPELVVYGNDFDTPDGTGVRDYIHVVDLALGHIKAVEKVLGETGSSIYNLGTGIGYSVLDIIAAVEKAIGRPLPYKFGPRRAGDIDTCFSDPSKAKRELGWEAKRNLEKMCEDTVRWQLNNPDGYGD
jgi:UDP-glucose 4-epimerase